MPFMPCISRIAWMLPRLYFPPCYVTDSCTWLILFSYSWHTCAMPFPSQCYVPPHSASLLVGIEMESFLATSPTDNSARTTWKLVFAPHLEVVSPFLYNLQTTISSLCSLPVPSHMEVPSCTLEPCKDQRSGKTCCINLILPANIIILYRVHFFHNHKRKAQRYHMRVVY